MKMKKEKWTVFVFHFSWWKKIYLLPRKVSNDTNLRMFQYKILKNILYLNKQLFIFDKKDTKLCSYCRFQDKIINHIFVDCKFAIKLWIDLRHYCQRSFDIPILNPESVTFGFFEIDPDLEILLNLIITVPKFQWSDWSNGVQWNCYFYTSLGKNKLWGPERFQC